MKRALNGEFDTMDGNPPTPTAMLGVEPTTTPTAAASNTAAYAKEIAALKEQLVLREELLRQEDEARKAEQQERDAALTALKRMEAVIIKAEHAMKLLELERNKLVGVIQELRAESHKIAEERLEAVRALGNAEKEIEALKVANKDIIAESLAAREKLASNMQELERLKVQNEDLGNECAAAKAGRDQEARRASKAEKECEETRTRLLSMEQRVADGVRQIQDDALRLVQLRRQHAQELADQREMFDEQLKKLAPLPSEETKRDLKSSGGKRSFDATSSAPM